MTCSVIVRYSPKRIPLLLVSIPRLVKPQQIAPGLRSPAFMTTARATSQERKVIPGSSTITALLSTKQTGWRLSPDGKHITLTDGCGIGRLRLVGNPKQKIAAFPPSRSSGRIVHRADGYYVQFAVKAERAIVHQPTGKHVGIDVGLKAY